MNKILSIWLLFKKGHVVAEPELWKKGQITATVLGGIFIALVQVLNSFGVDLPMSEDAATAIAAGVIAVVNWVLTIISSDKVGVTSKDSIPKDSTSNDQ